MPTINKGGEERRKQTQEKGLYYLIGRPSFIFEKT